MRTVVLVALAACRFAPNGAVNAGDDMPAPDASHIDAVAGEGTPDGQPTCLDAWKSHTIQVDPPAAITELNTSVDERDPFLTSDELTIYYSLDDGTIGVDMDIVVATRKDTASPFGKAKLLGNVDDGFDQSKIAMTADGLQVIYASDDDISGMGGIDVWQGSRAKPTDNIDASTETTLQSVDSNKDQSDPWLDADGSHLYLANVTSNHQVLSMSTRDGSGNYGPPQPLFDSGVSDADPTLSPDELVIVFSSNLSGNGDIYYATRASLADPFGTPILVPSVNTNDHDGDPHLSADGCHLYFASDTNSGGIADYNLYVATAHP